jgi:hypothetical protein
MILHNMMFLQEGGSSPCQSPKQEDPTLCPRFANAFVTYSQKANTFANSDHTDRKVKNVKFSLRFN